MKKLLLTSTFTLLSFATIFGQAGTVCWRKVSAGQNFTLAIKADGTLWGWGINSNQLGLGYSGNQNLPIQIGTANDWMTVSAGADHALAIKTTGTLWAWGSGIFGQLGNGLFNSATWNVTQVGTATDWLKVSAGTKFSLAIKTNGTLWSWGLNGLGQLGNGTIVNTNIPNQVGTATNWSKIDAGNEYSLAIDTGGFLYAWGDNTFGQFGNGTNTGSLSPMIVSSSNFWTNISAGFTHSIILNSFGFMFTAGDNSQGQLGNGTNTASNTFIPATSTGAQFQYIAISAGQYDSLAIKNDNTLWSWGNNNQGQLGLGNNTNTNTLSQVGSSNTWFDISAGYVHSQALENNFNLWSTGRGLEGQLAIGSNTAFNTLQFVSCPTSALSVNEINIQKANAYPNPTNGIINLDYNLENASTITLKITTIQGQLIQETKIDKSSGLQTDSIDLSALANGMYFISIHSTNANYSIKVIKE